MEGTNHSLLSLVGGFLNFFNAEHELHWTKARVSEKRSQLVGHE